jgi:hypothetical protein
MTHAATPPDAADTPKRSVDTLASRVSRCAEQVDAVRTDADSLEPQTTGFGRDVNLSERHFSSLSGRTNSNPSLISHFRGRLSGLQERICKAGRRTQGFLDATDSLLTTINKRSM